MSEVDKYYSRSLLLKQKYCDEMSNILTHNEGHRVPTGNSAIYPQIKSWIMSILK